MFWAGPWNPHYMEVKYWCFGAGPLDPHYESYTKRLWAGPKTLTVEVILKFC